MLSSILTRMICSQEPQTPKTRWRAWRKEALPVVWEGSGCRTFKETGYAQVLEPDSYENSSGSPF